MQPQIYCLWYGNVLVLSSSHMVSCTEIFIWFIKNKVESNLNTWPQCLEVFTKRGVTIKRMANIGAKLDILSNDMKDLQLRIESILLLWDFRVSCSLFLDYHRFEEKYQHPVLEVRAWRRIKWYSISQSLSTVSNWYLYPNYDNQILNTWKAPSIP